MRIGSGRKCGSYFAVSIMSYDFLFFFFLLLLLRTKTSTEHDSRKTFPSLFSFIQESTTISSVVGDGLSNQTDHYSRSIF